MILSDLHFELTYQLKNAGLDSSELEAKIFICHVLGINPIQFSLSKKSEVSEEWVSELNKKIKRRCNGEPIAYIIGEQEFYGITFKIRPGVLVPRQETERLVENAVDWLKSEEIKLPRIADLGCGCGCIGISILSQVGGELYSFDKSEIAFAQTKENIEHHNLDRAQVFLKDVNQIGEEDYQKFDLVCANPPYVAENDTDIAEDVKSYEPHEALFSGPDGHECIRAWSQKAAQLLRPGGLALFEIGYKQGLSAKKIFLDHSLFESVEVLRDYEDRDRIIKAVRNNNGSFSRSRWDKA